MSYIFSDNQLKVCHRYLNQSRNKSLVSNTRLIILEHILPTTSSLIQLLDEAGVEIDSIIAKPYSIDNNIMKKLKSKYNVIKESYEKLEETDLLVNILLKSVNKSKTDKKKIVIIDVGGYFAKPIISLYHKDPDSVKYICGIIEDTTFGHNRYLEKIKDIPVPVFSVARSELKEIEARYVGNDAVIAMESLLRKQEMLISGRRALVIGYGMIGQNVALSLKRNNLNVSVYDRDDTKHIKAFVDGYQIHKKAELIKNADIIFFATGNPDGAFTFKDIEDCKNGVILASVGSKDTEFDVKELKAQAKSASKIGKNLVKYKLSNSNEVIVAKEGTAVNFLLPSIPSEVLDIVFSEILVCMFKLLRHAEEDKFPLHTIHTSTQINRNSISKDWLRYTNK